MVVPARKYTVDTNLWIAAFRDPAANAALRLFHTAFAPFEYLTAVVAQELRAGARTVAAAKALDAGVLESFARRGRVLTPSYSAWVTAGEVCSALAARERLDLARLPRSVLNDVLLAATCRESGVVLVTANGRDFARIRRVLPFEYVAPWPTPRR